MNKNKLITPLIKHSPYDEKYFTSIPMFSSLEIQEKFPYI